MVKHVGIVANVQSSLASESIRELVGWLEKRNVNFCIDTESARCADLPGGLSKIELIKASDLIVVLGGDGTFLSIARMMDGRSIPILGVNLGKLGFLTEFALEEMLPALEKALAGDYTCEDRIMLDVSICREGKNVASYTILNDLVITRNAPARMVDVHVWAGGMFVNKYTADGLIVSTPTGSTAYNLSAGGPIVYPTLNAIIISPICPHTFTNRPVVIPDDQEVELWLAPDHVGEAVASLDGQVGYQLSVRDKITAKRSKDVTRIIQSPYKNYYELLRGKLKWGGNITDDHATR
ncbi:NAD kinase [hydrothermal vent metagenome]|uniref:NAD kinase n=1 Tax=hydrothermal vent metagenome TaxID=652676 RepID=A0A3B1CA71_9ZZZZ